ncbi:hypothetical protein DYB25_012619, partial [Aphanomyces astaci]
AISTITQVLVLFSSTATTACPPGGNVIVVEFVQDFGPLPLLVGNPSNLVYTNVGGSVALTVARLQVGNKENLPCSNRGTCDVTSVRTCPQGPAWFDMAVQSNDAHRYAICSNAGVCDSATGVCNCAPGFEGSACQRSTMDI